MNSSWFCVNQRILLEPSVLIAPMRRNAVVPVGGWVPLGLVSKKISALALTMATNTAYQVFAPNPTLGPRPSLPEPATHAPASDLVNALPSVISVAPVESVHDPAAILRT